MIRGFALRTVSSTYLSIYKNKNTTYYAMLHYNSNFQTNTIKSKKTDTKPKNNKTTILSETLGTRMFQKQYRVCQLLKHNNININTEKYAITL